MSEMKTLKFPGDAEPREIVDEKARDDISKLSENITLGLHTDGLVYIFIGGKPVGNGLSISGGTMDDITVVDGTMTILALAKTPTQSGTTIMIS